MGWYAALIFGLALAPCFAETQSPKTQEWLDALLSESPAAAREALIAAGGEKNPVVQKALTEWTKDLGDPDFYKRDDAAKALFNAGELAAPYLESALSSPDLETRSRAKSILGESHFRHSWADLHFHTAKAILDRPEMASFIRVVQALKTTATQTHAKIWKERALLHSAAEAETWRHWDSKNLRYVDDIESKIETQQMRQIQARLSAIAARGLSNHGIHVAKESERRYRIETGGQIFHLDWTFSQMRIEADIEIGPLTLSDLLAARHPKNGRKYSEQTEDGVVVSDTQTFFLRPSLEWTVASPNLESKIAFTSKELDCKRTNAVDTASLVFIKSFKKSDGDLSAGRAAATEQLARFYGDTSEWAEYYGE